MRVELKYATMAAGGQFVMTIGMREMPQLCADSWDSHYKVELNTYENIKEILSFTTGSIPFSRAHFGQGTGRIILDNVRCTGREQRLIDCPNIGVNNHNCHHSEDAGVCCEGELMYVPTAIILK